MSELPSDALVTVVGVGADGWAGLTDAAREALLGAGVVIGGPRQLDLLPGEVAAGRVAWPSPLRPAVAGLVAEHAAAGLVVLASGDPMHYGIGRALAEEVGAGRLHVISSPSSMALACARLGWPLEDVDVVSAVGRHLDAVSARLHPGRRLLVLSPDGQTPAQVARLLRERGFGPSGLTVLGDLGAPGESRRDGIAAHWIDDPAPRLNIVAITCLRNEGVAPLGLVPGLPEAAYVTDGQLTKREVRAVTLARLAPEPGELLWDVGAGTGTIGIEWMRAHPTCRAIAVEPRADRVAHIEANAARLGVPGLQVVTGSAPAALADLPTPDAVFVGGGLTEPGVVDACLRALRPGGRLVANTVTLESEALLVATAARLGGRLTRLEVSHAEPLGGFTSWSPARPVTQWSLTTPLDPPGETS